MVQPPPLTLFNSPCIGVCRIDERLGWCQGCRRTRDEIRDWNTASDERKKNILEQIALRASQM